MEGPLSTTRVSVHRAFGATIRERVGRPTAAPGPAGGSNSAPLAVGAAGPAGLPPPESFDDSRGSGDLASLLSRIAGTPRKRGPWPTTADLLRLARSDPQELGRDLGLGPAAARRLVAAFELGRRMEELRLEPRPVLATPGAVHRLLAPRARGLDRETFWCLLLDGRHRLMRTCVVSVGTLTCSLVHPREVFGKAVASGAAAIVVAHNHPSGDPEPSGEDREVTRRLFAAGELLGIPLVDHVILGLNGFRSLREEPSWPRS